MKLYGKRICLVCIFALLLLFFFEVNFSLAAFLKNGVNIGNQAKKSAELGYDVTGGNIFSLVQIVVNAFLAIIGVLLLIYLLYAGYHWMTAQGDEKKVDKAKETIQRAITGLIIIVAAYAISIFVVGRLEAGTLNGGGGGTTAPSAPSADPDRFNDPDAT